MLTATNRRPFTIRVDDDQMTIRLALADGADPAQITHEQILHVLKEHHIAWGPRDEQRIEALMGRLRRGDIPGDGVIIVKGTPPIHGRDGRIVDLVAPVRLTADDETTADYYKSNRLGIVNTGTPVLEIIPPTPHRPGRNVRGYEVPARIGSSARVVLGANVKLSEDHRFVYAATGGRFNFADGVASVDPEVTVGTNVSFRTGNVDFEGDVIVDRDVFDRFEVRTEGSVVVRGSVEGARIVSGRDVTVKGAILGKRMGRVTAGGYIICAFATGARLEAGSHVSISKYCYDSHIRCDGALLCPEAVFAGGEAKCLGGAAVATLGTSTHNRTTLYVGIDDSIPGVLADLGEKIMSVKKRLAAERKRFQPYENALGDLRGVERENAARIVRKIQDLEAQVRALCNDVGRVMEQRNDNAQAAVKVRDRIHAGVELCFAGARTRFKNDVPGPVHIEPRRVGDAVELVALHTKSGVETVMPSEPYDITSDATAAGIMNDRTARPHSHTPIYDISMVPVPGL